MGSVTAIETRGRLTRADLDAMPDDGRRYELLDGAIIVSPSPGTAHQTAVMRLSRLLEDAAPVDYRVFVAPLDVALPTGDVLEPDVLVASRSIVTDKDINGTPALVVEVLSSSSRRRDLGDKFTAYRDAGCPSYWVVDPLAPRLLAWELRDGEYVEVADLGGEETWTATVPYAVSVRPADLVR
jgi:Uma2 family endonuclease